MRASLPDPSDLVPGDLAEVAGHRLVVINFRSGAPAALTHPPTQTAPHRKSRLRAATYHQHHTNKIRTPAARHSTGAPRGPTITMPTGGLRGRTIFDSGRDTALAMRRLGH